MISYFNELYYLQSNPDVQAAVAQGAIASGFEHYRLYGGKELRNPGPGFFASYYVANNPDVKAAVAQGAFTPLEHYELAGLKENRSPSGMSGGFDGARYLADFPDVAAAVAAGSFVSALDHYLLHGAVEQRPYHVAPAYFAAHYVYNEAYYLSHNPDIQAAVSAGSFTSGFQHFLKYGSAEGRDPSAFFDTRYYQSQNPSVLEQPYATARTYFEHFEQVGLAQNVGPTRLTAGFDAARYLTENPDVGAAVSAGGVVSALAHYLQYGAIEGRPAFKANGDTVPRADATFTLTRDVETVDEGGTVTFTLQTTNVPAGAQFTYTIGTTGALHPVSAADIVGGAMSGTITIDADGRATIPIALAADGISENLFELLTLNIAGQASGVGVRDTSRASTLFTNITSAAEGSTAAFLIGGGIAGQQVAYTISGVSAEDIQGGALTGTVTFDSNGSAIVPVILADDGVAEADETLTFAVGNVSRQITVIDAASTTPISYDLTERTDTLVGAAGDDVFVARQNGSLGADDRLNGNGGSDTLMLPFSVNNQIFAPSDTIWTGISSIENVSVVLGGTATALAFSSGAVFDSVFRTSGVSLRGETSDGAVTFDLSGADSGTAFSGAAAITVVGGSGTQIVMGGTGATTVNATSTGGDQTIATGGGNDTVTSSAGVGRSTAISTGAGNDTIVAGFSTDLITGGLGADTMTGGGGGDTFAFGANGSVIGASMDAILDFNTGGGDILTFAGSTLVLAADGSAAVAGSNVQTSAGGLVAFHASDSTLALKTAAVQADAELDAAGSIAMFVDGGNSYVYYAGTAAGNLDDQLVQLTGMSALTTISGGAVTTIA